jgi:hypothetical protein
MVLVGMSPALASDLHEVVVDLDSAIDGTYRTGPGDALEVVTIVDDVAERIVTGTTRAGQPVQIVVQSAPLDDAMKARLRQDASEPIDARSLT